MTKFGGCDSMKYELGEHIAKNAKGQAHGLKNGFSAIGLETYIASECEAGEIIKVADWIYEGYTKDSVMKMFKRMIKAGQVIRPKKGVYQVC
jgi:hypothetical protein